MSEETIVAPAAATQNTAAQTTEQPGIVEPDATGAAAQEGDATEKPEKTAEQKELEYLRRKATKADRNNARLYQEKETLREQLAKVSPNEESEQWQADPYEIARALANEIVKVDRVDERSNNVAKDGEKRFKGEFGNAVRILAEEAGPMFDRKGLPTALGEALLDADDPAALIHYLGSNPSLADELNGLTQTQMGRRIERFEAQMKAKPAPKASNAPPPIKPLNGGSSSANVDLEHADMAAYKAARAKQGARWAR